MIATKAPALIALDWGTSSLRAYLVSAEGEVIERRHEVLGILNLADGGFAAALEDIAGPWLARHASLPLLAAGMIGSRQGWREAPYAATPAGLPELARGLVAVELERGRRLWIVPGIAHRSAGEAPDVMRGEETQLLGALAEASRAGPAVAVLPGTHSKWAIVEGERILSFATFMTGELYALLKAHSILGRLIAGEAEDPQSFRRGLALASEGRAATGDLLHRLFSARSLALFDELPAAGIASYLSGLLIASELEGALALLATRLGVAPERVTLIGERALSALYAVALAARGIAVETASPDAAARGLLSIARAAGLLAEA